MNRIERLIEELCPNGVPFKPLGEIGTFSRGGGFQKNDLISTGIPAIHYGEIHTKYGVSTHSTRSFLHESHRPLKLAKPGSLIIATTSEDDEAVAKATAWTGNSNVAVSGDALFFEHNLDPTFASHLFQSTHFRSQFTPHITGAKVRRISPKALSSLKAPIPPIEVQREIVEILDKLSTQAKELETELFAEIEARKSQFKLFRSQRFDDLTRTTATWSPLHSLASRVFSGGTPKSSNRDYYDGNIPWLRTQDIDFNRIYETSAHISQLGIESSTAKYVAPNSVIVAMYGATAGKACINAIQLTTNQACCNIECNPSRLHNEYLFHWISSQYQFIRSLGEGSQGNINAKKIKRLLIPVVDLPTQHSLASELNSLDRRICDLVSDLSAEIAARRQQYEYYRDRLLTFKELQ